MIGMNQKIVVGNIECESGSKKWGYLDIAETATRMIRVPVVIINGAKPGPTLGLLGGTHGTEYSSMEPVIRITKNITPNELSGAIIAVTCVSQNVLEATGYHQEITAYVSKIDSQNQSRTYDSIEDMARRRKNGSYTMTYRISDKLTTEIFPKCDYLIDCHGGDLNEDYADFVGIMPTGNEKIDSGQRMMAECFNCEAISTSTLLGSASALCNFELGIPAIYPEGGMGGNLHKERADFQYNGIINVLKRLEMIDGTPRFTPLPENDEDWMIVNVNIRASRGGLFYKADGVGLGNIVVPGQVLGTIENVFGETVETIMFEPEEKNRVYKMINRRPQWPVNAGDTLLTLHGIPKARARVFENMVREYTYWCTKCTKGH
jgi:hypothetical protein